MDRIAEIAVIVDPTADSHPGVSKAAAMAAALNARIELLVCDTRSMHQLLQSSFTVSLQPLLDELAAPLRARGIDVTLISWAAARCTIAYWNGCAARRSTSSSRTLTITLCSSAH